MFRRGMCVAAAFILAAVAVAILMMPGESEAIPAFTRQTGEVCSKCHFITWPALNDYGRQFKRRAYTYVREEALVKPSGSLSIPVTLNATLVVSAKYTNATTNGVAPRAPGYTNGTWSLPLEAPVLIAGRLGRNVGFFGELGQEDGKTANGTLAAVWKMVSSFDMGDFRMGLNVFNTFYGWTAGLETTNVFGQHGEVLNGADVSALTSIGMTKLNTQGITLWAGNHLWTIGLTGMVPDVYKVGKNNFGTTMIPGIRLAFTPTVMGWDLDVGGGILDGTAGGVDPATGLRFAGAHMGFLDAQAQGEIGDDVSIGVYADYAHTVAKGGVKYNLFGATPLEFDETGALIGGDAQPNDRTDGWSLRAMVKPVEGWIFGGGYGETRNTTASGVSSAMRIWNIGIIREIYANAEIKLLYGQQRLDALYPANPTSITASPVTQTTKSTTLQFEALM